MHTKNVRMRPVPLWGRCTGSTDFTSRKKNTRKTNGATKQHSMRDQRQLWKSFSSSFKLGDMRVGTVGAYVIRIRITVQLRGIKTL